MKRTEKTKLCATKMTSSIQNSEKIQFPDALDTYNEIRSLFLILLFERVEFLFNVGIDFVLKRRNKLIASKLWFGQKLQKHGKKKLDLEFSIFWYFFKDSFIIFSFFNVRIALFFLKFQIQTLNTRSIC